MIATGDQRKTERKRERERERERNGGSGTVFCRAGVCECDLEAYIGPLGLGLLGERIDAAAISIPLLVRVTSSLLFEIGEIGVCHSNGSVSVKIRGLAVE